MLFYVFFVLLIIKEGVKTSEEWNSFEESTDQELEKLIKWHNEEKVDRSLVARVFRRYFLGRTNQDAKNQDKLVYLSLRHEFILERSSTPPFEVDGVNRVSEDFRFSRYLGMCFGRMVGHAVDLEVTVWSILAVCTTLFYFVVKASDYDEVTMAWIWCSIGYILILANMVFETYIRGIRMKLINIKGLERDAELKRSKGSKNIGNGSTQSTESSALLGENGFLPDWCGIDLEKEKSKKSFSKMITPLLFGETSPNLQQSMFIFHEHGTHFTKWMFQLTIFTTSLHVALFFKTYFPVIHGEYGEDNIEIVIAYILLSCLPVIILRANRISMVQVLVQIESVGDLRRPQIVQRVNLEEKTTSIVSAFIVLYKIQMLLNNLSMDNKVIEDVQSDKRAPSIAAVTNDKEIMDVYNLFDKERKGSIKVDFMKKMLLSFSKNTSDESEKLDQVFANLDTGSDGYVSQEEFISWYKLVMSTEMISDDSSQKRAEFLFKMFDEDDSGHITFGEFKTTIDKLDVGFTVDDIGSLVYELDENGDGQISEHEFVELIERYHIQ
uniref:EF-hand domain-containing protein n=1 Tax=Proboscia inermis TaxID=420281 RepID=A0A7S0BYC4_9STRA